MVASAPLFSVVVPTHKRPRSLLNCLRALASLNYPHDRYEVIVVEDGSSGGLDELTEQFRDQIDLRLISQPRAGVGAARNAGAREARGKYLAFTADDCAPSSNWLQALEDRYAADPTEPALGGSIQIGCPDNLFATASQMLVEALCFGGSDGTSGHLYFTPNNLAVSAERFRKIDGFDSTYSLSAGEDRDFCGRWEGAGFGLAYCPMAEVTHRHPLSLSQFIRMHWRYGRGSGQFHVNRAHRSSSRMRFQSPRYYLGLVLYPMRRFGLRAARETLLILVAQIVSAAGVVAESSCRRLRG